MQSGKKVVENVKESAANTAASAKAGLDKTKATVKEKAEKLTTRDPVEKESAALEKEQRKAEAELNKEEAKEHNEAARRLEEAGGPHPGYKTWGSTTEYTTTDPVTGEYYTTTGTGTTDPRHHPGPTGGSDYR